MDLLSYGDRTECPGIAQRIFAGQRTGKERAEQRELRKSVDSPLSVQQNIPQCTNVRKLSKAGRTTDNDSRFGARCLHTVGDNACSHQTDGKNYNLQDIEYSPWKGLASVVGST